MLSIDVEVSEMSFLEKWKVEFDNIGTGPYQGVGIRGGGARGGRKMP